MYAKHGYVSQLNGQGKRRVGNDVDTSLLNGDTQRSFADGLPTTAVVFSSHADAWVD
jgi:hypothetical protein